MLSSSPTQDGSANLFGLLKLDRFWNTFDKQPVPIETPATLHSLVKDRCLIGRPQNSFCDFAGSYWHALSKRRKMTSGEFGNKNKYQYQEWINGRLSAMRDNDGQAPFWSSSFHSLSKPSRGTSTVAVVMRQMPAVLWRFVFITAEQYQSESKTIMKNEQFHTSNSVWVSQRSVSPDRPDERNVFKWIDVELFRSPAS